MIFALDSYWRREVPKRAKLDPESDRYIAHLAATNPRPFLGLAEKDWAMPVYRATTSDPVVTIEPTHTGPTATFRLPADAEAMAGNDAALLVIDETTNQDISLFEFRRSDEGEPEATGLARYYLDTEGLDARVGGTIGNGGHRGLPGLVSCIRREHLERGFVGHRLKIAIPAPGEPEDGQPIWPMAGFEKGRGGVIPEGMLLRIKPSVDLSKRSLTGAALVVAKALKHFGAIIGDTGGVATLKVERSLEGLDATSLAAIGWSDYEFVRREWGSYGWQ